MLETIVIFVVLLALSGFFSSAEIALMSISNLQVDRMVKQKLRNAKTLQKLKSNPHRLLETILIGNNLVNIAAAAFATSIAMGIFESAAVGIATGVTTVLVLLFGEIIPKSIAVNHRKRLSLSISPLLFGLQWLLTPVIFVVDAVASFFTRFFGEAERERVTEEEVRDLIVASEKDGMIKKREREMIQGVLDLDDMNIEEIMTPRLDVFCLEMHQRVDEVIDAILETGYSRVPVYDKRMDNIKGVVLVRNLLRTLREGKQVTLKEVMQEALCMPSSKKLDKLLREFQKRKNPFAIVVDEHGLFIGIVTMEDVLEELVGEIYDEKDPADEAIVVKTGEDSYRIPAKIALGDLNAEYHFGLPESQDYDTMGGLFLDRHGRVPKEGASIEVNGWRLVAEKVTHNRVVIVVAERLRRP